MRKQTVKQSFPKAMATGCEAIQVCSVQMNHIYCKIQKTSRRLPTRQPWSMQNKLSLRIINVNITRKWPATFNNA